MPVDYQHVPLKLTGVDTKTDPKNALDGRLIIAENCVMQKTGKLQSRAGYTRRATSSTHIGAKWIGNAGNLPLTLVMDTSGSTIRELNSESLVATGLPKEFTFAGGVDLGTDSTGTADYADSFACNGNNLGSRVFSVHPSGSSTTFKLFDPDTKITLQTATYASPYTQIAVAGYGQRYAALFPKTGGWRILYSLNDGSGLIESTVPGFAGLTAAFIDVCVDLNGNIGCLIAVAGDKIYFQYYDPAVGWSATTSTAAYGTTFNAIALARNTTSGWRVVTASGVNVNYGAISSTGVIAAPTAVSFPTFAGFATTTYQVAIGNTSDYIALTYCLTVGGNAAAEITVICQNGSFQNFWGSRIAAKAYSGTDGVYFTLVNMQETGVGTGGGLKDNRLGYSTYYVVRCSSTQPVGQYAQYVFSYCNGNAWALPAPTGATGNAIRTLNDLIYEEARYFVAARGVGKLTAVDRLSPINYVAFNLQASIENYLGGYLPTVASLNGALYTNAWGVIYEISPKATYYSVLPSAIPFAPEPIAYTKAAGTLTGTFQYLTVYELFDSAGKKIYSVPSVPVSVTLAAENATVTYRTPIGFIAFQGTAGISRIGCSVYRTTANGINFYELTDAGTSTVITSFNDTVTDANLVKNAPLYTSGGILESSLRAPSAGVFAAKGRLWSISAENPNVVYFSGLPTEDQAPFFNDVLSIQLDDVGGAINAVAEMDEKIVIFKKNAIFVTAGQGPDNDGVTNAYPSPQLISVGIGCKWTRSVVLTDEGLMFMSNEGIYLLTRGLQVVYIGAPVEDYNALVITDALNLVDRQQIIFYSNDGTSLCWDEFHKQWSVFTPIGSNAASVHPVQNVPTYINRFNGYYLTEGGLTDNGTPFQLRIKTGWISLTGIEGFQRFRRVQFAGNAANTLTMKLSYDFDSTVAETYTITAATAGSPYQWEAKPARQKCEAIQFEITSAGLTSAMDLSAFSIEAGAKKGTNRLAPSKRVQGV